jgi:hypothetical protein
MASLLHIDSSPRGDLSKSRKLAKEFIAAWQDQHPDDVIAYRDLRQTPFPHVTEDWIAAYFTPPAALTPEMTKLLKFSEIRWCVWVAHSQRRMANSKDYGLDMGDEARRRALDEAQSKIQKLVGGW